MTVDRRTVIKGALAAGVATQVLKVPAAPAQAAPIRVGFLTVKTGPLASGGLQMEQGLTVFFKERNNMLAGRPVELHTADTAGNPAQARTKTQELVERLNVAVLIGPLAAFEALGDRRLRPLVAHADPVGGRRGGHDPAQAQSVVRARELHVGATEPSARRIRRQGPRLQARRGDRRRLRVRPRERGRLPARVRGQRRQGGAEAVYAAQRARLRQLHLAAQAQSRCGLYRTCRLERLQVHPSAQGIRQQGANPRRLHAGRRIAAAADGRRRARRHDRQLVFGRARFPDQQEVRRGDPAGLQDRPRCVRRRDLRLRRGARARAQDASAARPRTRTPS